MARLRRTVGKRVGVWGLAVTAWDIWQRIPPKHRKRLLAQARKHGPRIAREAIRTRRKTRARRPGS